MDTSAAPGPRRAGPTRQAPVAPAKIATAGGGEQIEPPANLAEQLTAAWSRWNHLPVMPRELIEPIVARLWPAIGHQFEVDRSISMGG